MIPRGALPGNGTRYRSRRVANELLVRLLRGKHLPVGTRTYCTEPETEDSLKKEANELLVCLLRGKNLPVMDKNLLSSGGARRCGNRLSGAIDATSSPQLHLLDGVEILRHQRVCAMARGLTQYFSRRLERPVRVPEPGRGKAQVASRQEEHQPPVDADLPLSL